MRLVATILIALCASALLPGQEKQDPPGSSRKLEKIREALDSFKWKEAEEASVSLTVRYPQWAQGWKVLAGVYMETGQPERSEEPLRRLVAIDSAGYPEAYIQLAKWSFSRGDYLYASVLTDKFLRFQLPGRQLSASDDLLVKSVRFSLEARDPGLAGCPEKLTGPVNTSDNEYFPSVTADGSVLTFTRQARRQGNPVPMQEDLWRSAMAGEEYGMPEPFPAPVNSAGNDGTQSLSQDGRIMFFTSCGRPDTKGGCDLYYCVRSGNEWSTPVNLGFPVNSRYWESTPFLTADGRSLWFSSNRPGGSGGMDIWISHLLKDGSWSAPVNAGPPVNTADDELSPLILSDGNTLFFASDGHIGYGGFDLYCYRRGTEAEDKIPVNLGPCINSWRDETGITVNTGKAYGYFASNRDSAGGMDIFRTDLTKLMPAGEYLIFKGTVRDARNLKPAGASVEIIPYGDSAASRVESDPADGSFVMAIPRRPFYRLGASRTGYLPYSALVEPGTGSGVNEYNLEILLEPAGAGMKVILNNIFFDTDSWEVKPESAGDLQAILDLLDSNPGMVVEIAGHTDRVGTEEYNLLLSRKRAEAVRDRLVAMGAPPESIIARGYGFSRPVAGNDSEEGRRLNRRTELLVVRPMQVR